ncbi:hypothetical protein BH10PSE13_BH10PSE13_15240 [soil metagenome]
MDMSNCTGLHAERAATATAAHGGLIQWIMLPFETLHRQSWSAPWDADATVGGHRPRAR